MTHTGLNTPCTLEMMLAARDMRRERQLLHFRNHPDATLVVATVVAPGMLKLTADSLTVAKAQREIMNVKFGNYINSTQEFDIPSGPETWLSLSCSPEQAKAIAVDIEDNHTLGRLMDIDVILPSLEPMSRTTLGFKSRTCLLCDNDARLCMRSKKHSKEEILAHIATLVTNYRAFH